MENKEQTVGQILMDARTNGRRKRELATIAKLLCIREEYLDALEKGDYPAIPEAVYTLGFARNYALELGLDPDEIALKVKKEMGLIPDVADDESDVAPVVTIPENSPKKTNFLVKYWKYILGGVIAILILIGAIAIFVGASNDENIADSDTQIVTAVTEPQYTVAVRERFGTENASDAKIIIQATKESWVKIEDARANTVFSRVLVAGDVYYMPNMDNYKGTFGNAGGVDIWVNGTLAPKLGAPNTRKDGVLMTEKGLGAGE